MNVVLGRHGVSAAGGAAHTHTHPAGDRYHDAWVAPQVAHRVGGWLPVWSFALDGTWLPVWWFALGGTTGGWVAPCVVVCCGWHHRWVGGSLCGCLLSVAPHVAHRVGGRLIDSWIFVCGW